MSGGLKSDPPSRVQPKFTLLENAIAVPSLGAIEKDLPLYRQKRDVQRIEEGHCRQPPFQIGVDQREIRSHGAASILPVVGQRMRSQRIFAVYIESKSEIVFDGQLPARRS